MRTTDRRPSIPNDSQASDDAAERAKMRKLPTVLATLGLLGLISVPGAVEGQTRQTREGFWFNVGLGYGSLGCQHSHLHGSWSCDNREAGLSGGLALGGTVSRKVMLGAGTNSWYKEQDDVTLTASTLTATVRFYPSATGGFFLLSGLGIGVVNAAVETVYLPDCDCQFSPSGLSSESKAGGGAVLGLGYDVRVARNVSLTPYWNGVGILHGGDARSSGSWFGQTNFGQVGLGLTVH
jgi:hypothetical protein